MLKAEVLSIDCSPVKTAADLIRMVDQLQTGSSGNLLILVSALGQTPIHFENLVTSFFTEDHQAQDQLDVVRNFHLTLAASLFPDPDHPIFDALSNLLVEIEWILEDGPVDARDYTYDQIMAVGPLLSSTLLSYYLQDRGLKNTWIDARNFILTDNAYQRAAIAMDKTEQLIRNGISPLFERGWVITQAGIGTTSENFSTTLGDAGAAVSAAVFARSLNAGITPN